MIRMQNENPVHGAGHDGIDTIGLARDRKGHMQEIFRIRQVVSGINKRLANGIFIGHGRQGGHFGNQTMGRNRPLFGIMNVQTVVIKRRQGPHNAAHHGHGVGVTTKTFEKIVDLLVHHGVVGDGIQKVFLFRRIWQIPV